MMPGINVNVDVVSDVQKHISEYIRNIETVDLAAIDNIINQVDISWKSRYTEEYIECIRKTRKKLVKLIDDLRKLEKMLGNTVTTVEEAESRLKKILSLGLSD